jgi:hypothetical protein
MNITAAIDRWSPVLTRITGGSLVVLGIIHLIAVPFYMAWFGRQLAPGDQKLVIAGMRLNFILVGILLIPLGLSTYWAGRALQEAWAFRVAVMSALTLLCLPVLLVTTMPLESLDAPLFRAAIVVVVLACLTQILALGGFRRIRNNSSPGRR